MRVQGTSPWQWLRAMVGREAAGEGGATSMAKREVAAAVGTVEPWSGKEQSTLSPGVPEPSGSWDLASAS
jgi:hypothetical protein